MTLHDAIIEALANLDNSASSNKLANYINKNNLYSRSDFKPVNSSQIIARVNSYPSLFAIDSNNQISSTQSSFFAFKDIPLIILNIIRNSGYSIQDADVIIGAMLIFTRFSHDKEALGRYGASFDVENLQSFFYRYEFTNSEIDIITNSYERFREDILERIIKVIHSIDFVSFSAEQFTNFFNHWQSMFGKTQLYSGTFNTPGRVNNLIIDQLDNREYADIFDPYAGQCTTICYLNKRLANNPRFILQDFNEREIVLGKLNLLANEISNFKYKNVNSIEEFSSGRYDLVVFNPPFGLKIEAEVLPWTDSNWYSLNSKYISSESVFITQAVENMAYDGQAIIVLPESFFFSSSSREIRERLIESNMVRRIISLPTNAFKPYAGIKTSIIVLNKENSHSLNQPVEFIDLSAEHFNMIPEYLRFDKIVYTSKISSSYEEIRSNNYNLSVNAYYKPELENGKSYRRFSEIIKSVGRRSPSVKEFLNSEEGVPYIQSQALAKPEEAPFLNKAKIRTFLEASMESIDRFSSYSIFNNSILISRLGNNLNPTIYNGLEPIIASPNIISFTVKKSIIDPLFLVLQLREEYVSSQLDKIRTLSTVPTIKIQDLNEVMIWVPEIKKQELFIKDKLADFIVTSEESQSKQADNLDYEIMAALKHEFGNLKNPLLTGITNLEDFVNDHGLTQEKISFRPGARTVSNVLDGLKLLVSEMGSIIDDMTGALGTSKNLVKTNVHGFFNMLNPRLSTNHCEVEVSLNVNIELSDTFYIDSYVLMKVFRNLVTNAEKHGYSDGTIEKNVLFDVYKSEDGQWLEINYINDGSPFNEGFSFQDYITFGKKTGTVGSGIGGYLISKIIKDHSGTFEEIQLLNSNLSVSINNKQVIKGIHFLIRLPLSNDEDTIQ